MHRRALVTALGGAASVLAGCAAGRAPGSESDEEVPESSIQTIGSDCAHPADDWAIARVANDTLTIVGITPSPDPCYAAEIPNIVRSGSELAVDIDVRRTLDDDEECPACAGAIGYEASVSVTGADIETITVDHLVGETHAVTPFSRDANTRVTTQDIETVSREPGQSDTLEAFASGPIVVLEGYIPAPNPCYLAAVRATAMEDETLKVDIEVVPDQDEEGCAQVLAEVGYHAMVGVTGPALPREVIVDHRDGETHQLEVSRWNR